MPTFDRLMQALDEPLFHMAGAAITLGSILVGLLIVVSSYLVALAAGLAVTRMLASREAPRGARYALAKIVRYAIVLVGGMVAVTSLGIRIDALLAASTVVLVGIGFGLQNIAQNFLSGLILLIERPVARGDFVQLGSSYGTVAEVGLRATRVVTRDEVTIIVPNSELVTTQVINHSTPTTNLRIAVRVGVAYGTDVSRVRDVLLAVARADGELLAEPGPEVRFEDFGESSLDFSLRVWILNPRADLQTASRLRFAIAESFRTAGIVIPFPQREIHIRSDGGR